MDMAKGSIMQSAAGNGFLADAVIGAVFHAHIAMHAQQIYHPVLRGMEVFHERAAVFFRKCCAVNTDAKLLKLGTAYEVFREDINIFREIKAGIGGAESIAVMVARRNKHGDRHPAKACHKLLTGFAVAVFAVKQIAAEKHKVNLFSVDKRLHTLQKLSQGVGFYRFNGNKPINPFRAWVELGAEPAEAPAMLSFTRGESGEGTTGIESVELGEELVIYDLAGRRVQKMEKGIYIVNGRKVVVK